MSKQVAKVAPKSPAPVVPAPATTTPAASPAQVAPTKVARPKGKIHLAYIGHMAANKVLDPNAKITIVVAQPKFVRASRVARFAKHRNGQTVSAYIDAVAAMPGQSKASATKDLQWDVFKGFVTLG